MVYTTSRALVDFDSSISKPVSVTKITDWSQTSTAFSTTFFPILSIFISSPFTQHEYNMHTDFHLRSSLRVFKKIWNVVTFP